MGELRRTIGRQRGIPYFAIDLFLGGGEERLADGDRLNAATDTATPSLFMLLKVSSDRLALAAIFQNTHGEDWDRKGGGWEDLEKEDPDGGLAALDISPISWSRYRGVRGFGGPRAIPTPSITCPR